MENSNCKIGLIESLLNSSFDSELKKGHTDTRLVKFYDKQKKTFFVAKFKDYNSRLLSEDLSDNIFGFKQIEKIGASKILPNYSVVELEQGVVLCMDYLENSFSDYANKHTEVVYERLYYGLIPILNLVKLPDNRDLGLKSVKETLSKIKFFAKQTQMLLQSTFIQDLRDLNLAFECKYISLFLLDFTPDNLFVVEDGVNFIDPWRQSTYLGHTLISFGQFITIAKEVYNLPGSEAGCKKLTNFCKDSLAFEMGINSTDANSLLWLGNILQNVLSAFVRNEDPAHSEIYAKRAISSLEILQGKRCENFNSG